MTALLQFLNCFFARDLHFDTVGPQLWTDTPCQLSKGEMGISAEDPFQCISYKGYTATS